MPGFNGTGPRGMGPMTGGGRGLCAVPLSARRLPYVSGGAYPRYTAPQSMSFPSQATPQQDIDFLKGQAQAIRGQLEQIEDRIREMASEKE